MATEGGKRWWKIRYDDGDREELNYRELAKLAQPPDFSKLQYESPVAEFESSMRTSGGAPALVNDSARTKPGEPGFFTLESQERTFISVFLVQDSKFPIQGAYMLRSDFEVETRDLTLTGLQEAHSNVRLSPHVGHSVLD
jgi:hypothetical protein